MTREEAIEISKHHVRKSDTVIVMPDGTIYLGADNAAEILKNQDAHLIKGDESLKPKVKKQKDTDQ